MCILPNETGHVNVEGSVKNLTKIWWTIVQTRYQCLDLTKNMEGDFSIYDRVVNKTCERC